MMRWLTREGLGTDSGGFGRNFRLMHQTVHATQGRSELGEPGAQRVATLEQGRQGFAE